MAECYEGMFIVGSPSDDPCYVSSEVPTVLEVRLDGFLLKAPNDITYGYVLTLQVKEDGEYPWINIRTGIENNEEVSIGGLKEKTWYNLRWVANVE